MARRRSTFFEDLIEMGFLMPWWASSIVAAIAYFGFRHFAAMEVAPAPSGEVSEIVPYAVRVFVHATAPYLQYLIPGLFLLGTAKSGLAAFRRKSIFDNVSGSGGGWFRLSRKKSLDDLNWIEFEELVHELFRREGYNVVATKPGPDGGIDLNLSKDGETATVQCKHWRNKKVGVNIVREQLGVVTANKANRGYLVTSGEFTSEAEAFARQSGIILIDGKTLRKHIRNREPKPTIGQVVSSDTNVSCPRCSSLMVRRHARLGAHAGTTFWGCSRFPRCRGTRNGA
ncbi:MAG: restriction endonuclease [Woeseia sp.]